MFLENLSISVRRLCRENALTYKAAAKRCCLSNRCFSKIVRGKTVPSMLTLEKLCTGLDCTPNELLMPSPDTAQTSFREPMAVTEFRCFTSLHGLIGFPVCPRCDITLEREYQVYCDRCGQHLDWSGFDNAMIILPPR
ncbi:MAG: helix-turn-helix transcriptional regulator [Clostridiales bacterium]|nr:helix-turn-helix transcriptional regulator [Clostridiales bacterium]